MSEKIPSVVLKVNVYGTRQTIDLSSWAENLLIDPADIQHELEKQPRLYFEIGEITACAITQAERTKHDLEVWLSEKVSEIRNEAIGRGGKLPGYDTLEAEAKTDPEYERLYSRYIDAKEDASVLEVARDAMKMRQFMLTHMSVAQRAGEGE